MSALLERLKGSLQSRPRQQRTGPIGLHFAEEQVHAVQLRQLSSGKFFLRAWASARYPESRDDTLATPSRLQRVMTKLLQRGRFTGRDTVTALPPAMSRMTSLNYQVTGKTSDGEAILRLMESRLAGPIADYVIDFLPVRSDPNSRDRVALVATSKRSDVLSFLENLQQAGMEVSELEVGPAAINRLINLLPRAENSRGNVLVINYGAEQSYITLMSGRRLLMDKEVNFGSRLLIDQIARSLDVTPAMAEEMAVREGLSQQLDKPFGATVQLTADDLNPLVEIVRPVFAPLAEEVRRACLYAASESQGDVVEQVYTVGSIARWPGADKLLSEIARLPVAASLPLTAIFDTDDATGMAGYPGIGPDLATATGLALRGLDTDA